MMLNLFLAVYSHVYPNPASFTDPATAANSPPEASGDPATNCYPSPAAIPASSVPTPAHCYTPPAGPAAAASFTYDPTAAGATTSSTTGPISSWPTASPNSCCPAHVAVTTSASAAPAGQSLPDGH